MPNRFDDKAILDIGRSGNHARSVGDSKWVVSFLPGRTLSEDQARAALRVAAELDVLRDYAALLGLTVLELVGLATMDNGGARLWSCGDTAQSIDRLGQAQ